jgi:polar amino acid transport system substrate-binding protein
LPQCTLAFQRESNKRQLRTQGRHHKLHEIPDVKNKIPEFLLLLTLSLPCAADSIIIFGNANKNPKVYLEDKRPRGTLVEIMKYVDQRLPENFTYELYPWSRSYQRMLKGEGGIIGLSMNDDRLKVLDYSDAMYFDERLLVVTKGNEFNYQSIDDLKEKTVGVFRGVSYGEEYEQAKNRIFIIDEDSSPQQRLLKLLYQRIDVAMIGPGLTAFNIAIQQDPRLIQRKDQFVILPVPFKRDPNYLGFAKSANRKPFLLRFNEILKQGFDSGELQKIILGEIHLRKSAQPESR